MTDRTPTGDLPRCADCTCPNPGACPEQPAPLRDQLAEALQRHTVATALPTPFPPDLPETPWLEEARHANEARADAVLSVVEAALTAERQVAEQLIEQVLTPERARCKEATQRAETAERLAALYRQQIEAPADLLARVDAAEAAITEKDAEIAQLRRQVMGYRGLKEGHLRERNAAHAELIEAENLIERLCNDVDNGQRMVKAALTEQRERAEKAERERDEALAAITEEQQRADDRRTELLEERDQALHDLGEAERQRDEARTAVQRVRRLQEMTIASSCRAGAIEQAEDTLRLLDEPEAK